MFWVIYQDCGSIVIPELAFSTYGEAYTEITNGEYGEGYFIKPEKEEPDWESV
jgi:hypothetical protein